MTIAMAFKAPLLVFRSFLSYLLTFPLSLSSLEEGSDLYELKFLTGIGGLARAER